MTNDASAEKLLRDIFSAPPKPAPPTKLMTFECGHSAMRPLVWKDTIGGSTADCPVCGALLIFINETYARLFNSYMHEKNPNWPIDGAGTGYVEMR